MMAAGGRWFRVDTTWSQSEWLAVLSPASRLAWIELLGYVKAHGYDGKVRATPSAVLGRMFAVAEGDVSAMLVAAMTYGAIDCEGEDWKISGWAESQGLDGRVRLSGDEWALLRAVVFERDDYTCRYCGERGGRLECDHVVPVSRGGTNEMDNLVTACLPCNRSKRDKLLSEWRGRNG